MTGRRPLWANGLLKWGSLFLVLLLAVAFLFTWFTHTDRHSPKVSSWRYRVNQRQLAIAMLAYVADNDERFPNALTWTHHIPLEFGTLLKCPLDDRENVLSYDMLQRWSNRRVLDGNQAFSAILLYEIGPRGLAYRHHSGMHVAHMDGHIKWHSKAKLTPDIILSGFYKTQKPRSLK